MKTLKQLREKTLTPAEKKKREEIAKAIEKDDPDMPMDKKMAIATATAKKVAEGKKPVSQMTPAEKAANDKRRKEYNAYQKSKRNEGVDLDEAFTPKEIKMAIGVASDKRYAKGNMTGAVNAIEKIKKGLSDHPQVKVVLRRQNESLDEASYPLAKKWQSGAKMVKSGKLEFVRGSGGVHSIKMNGKSIGNFSLDDDAGMWVANLNGVRGQLTVDEIDDLAKEIPKRVQKESVELGEAAPKLKGNDGPYTRQQIEKAAKEAKVDIGAKARMMMALRKL